MTQVFSTVEVCRRAMIAPHQLVYALASGKIREPKRLNGRRCFSEKNIEEVKKYFRRTETGTLPK
jgi:DNA-binding transcriptional MerR regulator